MSKDEGSLCEGVPLPPFTLKDEQLLQSKTFRIFDLIIKKTDHLELIYFIV
jgi:hypothetical protein